MARNTEPGGAPGGNSPVRVAAVSQEPSLRAWLVDLLASSPKVEIVGAFPAMEKPLTTGVQPDVWVCARRLGQTPQLLPVRLSDDERRPQLSRRQIQVLITYTTGNDLLYTIARRLGIAEETVKTHLRRIRRKYATAGRHAPTWWQLRQRAIEDGYLDPPAEWSTKE